MRVVLPIAFCIACIAGVAKSHEFWVAPVSAEVPAGGVIEAHLRVGQAFEGSEYSYLPNNFRRFDYVDAEGLHPVEGVMGDRPAAHIEGAPEGLVVLVHETTDQFITWDDFADFVAFVEHKDATWTLEEHARRGLPENGTREAYSRYAKALVAVGSGEGEDREAGLLTEIVALENPYVDEIGEGFEVRLLYEGKPRAEAQIEVFEKAEDGTVNVFTVKTNGDGEATVPVKPGYRYMLDAVVLREPSAELAQAKNVQWESLWANLTFSVPG